MSAMPSERFHETLLAQYRDLIHEAFLESETEHKTRLNRKLLSSKLRNICKAALVDGISPREIHQLIDFDRAESGHYRQPA